MTYQDIIRLCKSNEDLRRLILSSSSSTKSMVVDDKPNMANETVTPPDAGLRDASTNQKQNDLEEILRSVMLQMDMQNFGKPRVKVIHTF